MRVLQATVFCDTENFRNLHTANKTLFKMGVKAFAFNGLIWLTNDTAGNPTSTPWDVYQFGISVPDHNQ